MITQVSIVCLDGRGIIVEGGPDLKACLSEAQAQPPSATECVNGYIFSVHRILHNFSDTQRVNAFLGPRGMMAHSLDTLTV